MHENVESVWNLLQICTEHDTTSTRIRLVRFMDWNDLAHYICVDRQSCTLATAEQQRRPADGLEKARRESARTRIEMFLQAKRDLAIMKERFRANGASLDEFIFQIIMSIILQRMTLSVWCRK